MSEHNNSGAASASISSPQNEHTVLTIEEAYLDFLTPPRSPGLGREQQAAVRAEHYRLKVKSSDIGPGRASGEEIEVYCWGTGRPVLVVHGWGGRGTLFEAYVDPLLEAGFRVIAFDAPGHGLSQGVLSSGPTIADSIEAVSRSFGPFSGLIAHSIGGAASVLALSRTVCADQVALLAPCCWILPILEQFGNNLGMNQEQLQALESRFRQDYHENEMSMEPYAARLRMPALIIHDPDDSEVAIAHGEALAAFWPGAQLVRETRVGHRRILRSKTVIAKVVAFLNKAELR